MLIGRQNNKGRVLALPFLELFNILCMAISENNCDILPCWNNSGGPKSLILEDVSSDNFLPENYSRELQVSQSFYSPKPPQDFVVISLL